MDFTLTQVMNSTHRGISSPPEDSLVFLLGLLNLGAVTCYSIFSFLFKSEAASLDTRAFINRKVQSTLDELVLNVHMATYYNSALHAEDDDEDDENEEEEERRAHSRRSGRQWISFFDLPNKSDVATFSLHPSSRTSKMLKTQPATLEEEFNALVHASQSRLTSELIDFWGRSHPGRQTRSTPKREPKTGRKSNRTRVLRRKRPTKSTNLTAAASKPVNLALPSTTSPDEKRGLEEAKTLNIEDAKQVQESMILKEHEGRNVQEPLKKEEGRAIDDSAQFVMQSSMSFDPSTPKRFVAIGSAYPEPVHPAFASHTIRKPTNGAPPALPAIKYVQRLASRIGETSPALGIPKGPASLTSASLPAPVPGSVIGRLIHLVQQTTPLTLDLLGIYNGDHQIGRQVDKKCTENLICEMNRQWKRAGNVEAALTPFLSIALSWWSKRNPSYPPYYQVPVPQALMATRAGWMGNNCQVLYPTTQECSPGTKWTLSRTRILPLVNHNLHPSPVQPPQWQPQPPRTWVTERPQQLRHSQADNKGDENDQAPKVEERQDEEEEEDEDENMSAEDYDEKKYQAERAPLLVTPTSVPAPGRSNKPNHQKLPNVWEQRDPGHPAPMTPTQKNDGKPPLQVQYLPNAPSKASTNTTKPVGPIPSPRIRPDPSNPSLVLGLPRNRDILAQPLNKPALTKPEKVVTTTEKAEDENVSYVLSPEEDDMFDSPTQIKKRVSDSPGNVELSPPALKYPNSPNVKKTAQEQPQHRQQQPQQQKLPQQQQQKKLPNREVSTLGKNNTSHTKVTELSQEPSQPWMGTPIWAGQGGGAESSSSSPLFVSPSSEWIDQVNSGQEERRVPQVFTVDDAVLDQRRQQMIMQYIRDRSVRPRRM